MKIHLIEPHHDDALGSASGLIYCDAETVLYTMTKSGDERDFVSLENGVSLPKSVKKDMNITEHIKFNLPDLHWDYRLDPKKYSYAERVNYYRDKYPFFLNFSAKICHIILNAKYENAFLAMPMGIEHPMHIVTMYTVLQNAPALGFNCRNLIFYADHPYDRMAEIGKISEVREYIEQSLGFPLIRCDDVSYNQELTEPVLRELYGDLHYGEFAGTLSNTQCSYLLSNETAKELSGKLSLHSNKVLYVTAQSTPFFKTGGLGNVAFQYCKSQREHVEDIRIFMPYYPTYVSEGESLETYKFEYEGGDAFKYTAAVEKRIYGGVTFYLMAMYDNKGERINYEDKYNSGEEFAVFCDALLSAGLDAIDYKPNILHCNDWQTGLIPFLMKTKYPHLLSSLKTIFTIHGYCFRGIFDKEKILNSINIGKDSCDLCISCHDNCPIDEIYLLSDSDRQKLMPLAPKRMSFMKAGIRFADCVSTVSGGFAGELMSYPDFEGIEVTGIRNGIPDEDYKFDSKAKYTYKKPDTTDIKLFAKDKKANKNNLRKELGLVQDDNIPLMCMVSRLSPEKGIDMVKNFLHELEEMNVQLVICGDDGDKIHKPYAAFFNEYQQEHKDMFAYCTFSDKMEHKLYAASDILLMPSLTEACGTTQMLAMEYGVLPLLSLVSGFSDSVLDYRYIAHRGNGNLDKGVGFYAYKDDVGVFCEVLEAVLKLYHKNDGEWDYIACEICAKTDFRWRNNSLNRYVKMYNKFTRRGIDNRTDMYLLIDNN